MQEISEKVDDFQKICYNIRYKNPEPPHRQRLIPPDVRGTVFRCESSGRTQIACAPPTERIPHDGTRNCNPTATIRR